ncbi:peroxiredoxin [Syntrophotalea acetylenivorans]|uniref:Peroxiredoxin n=1 Tax=Syntrophotalea acetylenivorans TaxID=1842532 RepID=A0A1L3GMK4_9BACT|nr:thioredoxin family protein [Syntrophotalea acetylenivorans]APG27121.1 peroxiredoxin [Syntrophotalea acetylenivorans]
MALVHSVDLPFGSPMPAFRLNDSDGRAYASDSLSGHKGLLVVFTCNHCPYAKAQWPRLICLAEEFGGQGINTVAINSNIHPDYPDDAPQRMTELVSEIGISFPYLVDNDQQVARAFRAQCTPDPYLFDGNGRLFYHGRIDDNWKDEGAVSRQELRAAMTALVAGDDPPVEQRPSMGCSIKWRQ